ncbi:MAG: glycoside hydrolase family 30 beta sandwich domain-containing protein, partial [Terracidiphilus sp.]
YWTEGGPQITDPDYQTDWSKWAATFNGIANNWARSITAWNLVLDEKGKPNIGPFDCGGVVTVENGTHTVTRSGQYWAFAHFSRHVRRGARVFATELVGALADQPDGSGVSHTGFRNADGTMLVVLANRGDARQMQMVLGRQTLEIDLPAESVQTLEWA